MTDIAHQNAETHDNRKLTSLFEITGSVLAMVYAMSIAMNVGGDAWIFLALGVVSSVRRMGYS